MNALKILLLSLMVVSAKAQTWKSHSAKSLLAARTEFNKKSIRVDSVDIANLPASIYLFAQDGQQEIVVDEVTILTSDHLIIGFKDMDLTFETLKSIVDRLKVLDKLQKAYSDASNNEYRSLKRNKQNIVYNDRRFFSALCAMRLTVRDIKKLYD